MVRRNPAPPPKRPPTRKQLAGSLARVRQFEREHTQREKPFDPRRAPTWRGSSRDLVVNGRQLSSGYAYELIRSEHDSWRSADNDDWDTVMVSDDEIEQATYVGERSIDGSACAVFEMPDERTYYAQLSHMTRNAGSDPELHGGEVQWFEPSKPKDWVDSPDRDWDLGDIDSSNARGAKHVGFRTLSGQDYDVFETTSGKIVAQIKSDHTYVDPRDIPEGLTPINGWGYKEEPPSSNGQHFSYSNTNFGRNKEDNNGWFQVDYATGSDYSGSSVSRSNYKTLQELLKEHHPGDSEPVVWALTHGGHGTYGIIVKYGDAAPEVREALDALDEYAVLDDSAHSELELEEQQEAWERWGKDDFIRAVAKLEGKDKSALEDAITDEQWQGVFQAMCTATNRYWEDQGGEGPWIDVKKIAEELGYWVEKEPDKYPQYTSDYEDEALDAFRQALPGVEGV